MCQLRVICIIIIAASSPGTQSYFLELWLTFLFYLQVSCIVMKPFTMPFVHQSISDSRIISLLVVFSMLSPLTARVLFLCFLRSSLMIIIDSSIGAMMTTMAAMRKHQNCNVISQARNCDDVSTCRLAITPGMMTMKRRRLNAPPMYAVSFAFWKTVSSWAMLGLSLAFISGMSSLNWSPQGRRGLSISRNFCHSLSSACLSVILWVIKDTMMVTLRETKKLLQEPARTE